MAKIVQVINSRDPGFGGPSIGSLGLNEALREQGHDALLLSAAYGFRSGKRGEPVAPAHHGPRRSYPASRPYELMASRALRRAIDAEVATADFVHIHGVYLLPQAYAYAAAVRHAVPYGLQAHGSLDPYHRAKSTGRKRVHGWVVGNRMIRNAEYVMFASAAEADGASDLVRPEQQFVQQLGVYLSDSPVPPAALTSPWPSPSNAVLFLGRLAKKKRPDLLIEAWSRARRRPEDRLLVAGPPEDYSIDELRQLAARWGVEDSVELLGPVTPQESAWLYAACATYVLPTENENFGVSIAEAMLAGCHVITTRQAAASAHVSAAGGGDVLQAPSSSLLVAALNRRLSGPRERREVNRRYARRELTWASAAQRLTERMGQSRTAPVGPGET